MTPALARPKWQLIRYALYLIPLVFLFLVPQLFAQNPFLLNVLILANIWAIFAMSWDILSGYTGQISFGHSFFIGLGGYTSALLSLATGWSPWLTIPIGGVVAALGGLILAAPALRLRGPYLALITLVIALALQRLVPMLNLSSSGAEGAILCFPKCFISYNVTTKYYYSLILLALVTVGLLLVARSRLGRAFEAIRDDEEAAAAAGLHVSKYKSLAFLISGFVAGLGGAFLVNHMTFASSGLVLSLNVSIEVIIAAVLGGMGTIIGPIGGAYFMVVLREYLRPLGIWRFFIFTLLAILVLFFLPRGLFTELRLRLRQFWRQLFPSTPVSYRPLQAAADQADGAPRPLQSVPSPKQAGDASDWLLEVKDLRKAFGGLLAVNKMSFGVHPGEILGFIGPNGAGKTTVFNLIMGLFHPDGGQVRFRGREITGWLPHRVVGAGIARTFQIPRPFAHKTVAENVAIPALSGRHFARSRSIRREEWVQRCCARTGLLAKADIYPSELPDADLRRLEIAKALATDPELLLLDEPFAGLSLAEMEEISQLIERLRREGHAIVLVDHNMRGLMKLVDRVVVINFGEKLAEGRPDQVAENQDVQEAYLAGGGR